MYDSGLVEFQNHSYNMHTLTPRKGIGKKYKESDDEYEIEMLELVLNLPVKYNSCFNNFFAFCKYVRIVDSGFFNNFAICTLLHPS